MSDETKETMGPTRRTVPQIVAAMRETFGPLADPAEPSAGWDVAGDALAFADEIEEEYGRENHCAKRYDKDGDEMPPHCAFDDLKIDRLSGQLAKMRDALGMILVTAAECDAPYMANALESIMELARDALGKGKRPTAGPQPNSDGGGKELEKLLELGEELGLLSEFGKRRLEELRKERFVEEGVRKEFLLGGASVEVEPEEPYWPMGSEVKG